ncbi:Hypothetical_protein [Hexamita inflata]|uniref:Hypothetical_protein n=1 Tax=Hexamita inflata TaxID=28002 RepID=A0AA86QXF4_9EUKA|nr:Hypothetical protein HINF_LOCUS53990 [Hexamita inflata]
MNLGGISYHLFLRQHFYIIVCWVYTSKQFCGRSIRHLGDSSLFSVYDKAAFVTILLYIHGQTLEETCGGAQAQSSALDGTIGLVIITYLCMFQPVGSLDIMY